MIKFNKHILPNGLRLLHHFDDSTQMVAVNVVYDVGSRDEHPGKTGFAHLFEHLMFGGSINIPEYDVPAQQAGAENNAWTNEDATCYYIAIPRQNVETAFWLESDRMLSLAFSEKSLLVQKQVVIEEFKQRYLSQPYGDVSHLVRAMAYRQHPYSWPTIGKEPKHIEDATLEDVKAFFFRHYAPNNAVLSVTGNISWQEALALTEKWFGAIERRDISARQLPQEPQQTAPRQQTVERNVPTDAIYKAYHIYGKTDPKFNACDMLSDILASGRSARLFQHLVMDKPLFSEINAYISGNTDPGLLHITGKPSAGVSLEEANDAIQQEIEKVCAEPIASRELEKLKNKFESEELFSNINYLNKATNLGLFELLGDAELINEEVDKYRAVDADLLQATAREVLSENNCSTLFYKSDGKQ